MNWQKLALEENLCKDLKTLHVPATLTSGERAKPTLWGAARVRHNPEDLRNIM